MGSIHPQISVLLLFVLRLWACKIDRQTDGLDRQTDRQTDGQMSKTRIQWRHGRGRGQFPPPLPLKIIVSISTTPSLNFGMLQKLLENFVVVKQFPCKNVQFWLKSL